MSLSDCIKCWDTPCTCGYMYSKDSTEFLIKFISGILNYKSTKEQDFIVRQLMLYFGDQ